MDPISKRIAAIEQEIRISGGPNKTALRYFNTAAKRWMDQCRAVQELIDICKEVQR